MTTFGGTSYFSGPNSTHRRAGLTVRRSVDSSVTWDAGTLIDPGFGAYSCLVGAPLARGPGCRTASAGPAAGSRGGGAQCGGVLYEGGGGVIVFVRFPLDAG